MQTANEMKEEKLQQHNCVIMTRFHALAVMLMTHLIIAIIIAHIYCPHDGQKHVHAQK